VSSFALDALNISVSVLLTSETLPRKISKGGKVLFGGEPSRLETAHLARRGRAPKSSLAADDPAHRRIMTQPFGIVDILVARKTAKHGLPQHSDESMAAVLAGPCVREPVAGHRGQAERVVEFSVGEQAGVGGDTDPRNWSISRRSKSSLSASAFDSPAEFAITASFDPE
jgi:hypothetical protein